MEDSSFIRNLYKALANYKTQHKKPVILALIQLNLLYKVKLQYNTHV
jgi:hypothetical protein